MQSPRGPVSIDDLLVSMKKQFTFYTTNDNGSVEAGQLLPAPQVPQNFLPVKGVDLATKGDVLVASNDSIVEFGIIGQYLALSGDTMTYPLTYAYVLSHNTYPTAGEAYTLGILQGTRIVYAAADTLTTGDILYADSRLTQQLLGDDSSWYGIALLTDKSVKYAVTIDALGAIVID